MSLFWTVLCKIDERKKKEEREEKKKEAISRLQCGPSLHFIPGQSKKEKEERRRKDTLAEIGFVCSFEIVGMSHCSQVKFVGPEKGLDSCFARPAWALVTLEEFYTKEVGMVFTGLLVRLV